MKKALFGIIIFFFFGEASFAENLDRLLQEGTIYYKIAKYESAVEKYEKIIQEGYESSSLYYNLGNAYFRLDEIPSAILYYERALRLSPNDAEIQMNLKIANSKIEDKIEIIPPVFFIKWFRSLSNLCSPDMWGYLCITFAILCCLSVFFYIKVTTFFMKKNTFYSSLLFLILFVGSITLGFMRYNAIHTKNEAIIFEPLVVVKSSPESTSVEKFIIHKGTKVYIKGSLNNWIKISLANGKSGWVEKESFQII